MSRDALPLLEGEGWGEVWSISGQVTHLTLSLSFQERGPAIPARRVNIVAHAAGEGGRGATGRGGDLSRDGASLIRLGSRATFSRRGEKESRIMRRPDTHIPICSRICPGASASTVMAGLFE